MISRRALLQGMAAAAAIYPFSWAFGSVPSERTLRLYNVHTDENLDIAYCLEGAYDYEALDRINHLMRCNYTNEVRPINLKVLDLLCDIKDKLGRDRRIEIISGYRSAEYNEQLRARSKKVARDSYHLKGLAIDFAIGGVSKNLLARAARAFFAGGVGEYLEFVHIDAGPVRSW